MLYQTVIVGMVAIQNSNSLGYRNKDNHSRAFMPLIMYLIHTFSENERLMSQSELPQLPRSNIDSQDPLTENVISSHKPGEFSFLDAVERRLSNTLLHNED